MSQIECSLVDTDSSAGEVPKLESVVTSTLLRTCISFFSNSLVDCDSGVIPEVDLNVFA